MVISDKILNNIDNKTNQEHNILNEIIKIKGLRSSIIILILTIVMSSLWKFEFNTRPKI